MPGVGTTHHIKLGDDYFIVRPGTYRKRSAPVFGARFTTGDPDYNTLSFWQHWVQRCWIGGFDAREWQDEAMYDKSVGVDTSYHEVLLMARDLGPKDATRTSQNWDLSEESSTQHQREFFVWSGSGTEPYLYLLSYESGAGSDARLYRWDHNTPDWVLVNTFSGVSNTRSLAVWGPRVYFGTSGGNLSRMAGTPGSETFTNVAKPSGVTSAPRAMRVWRNQLWVGFQAALWRLNQDETWDGSTAFYEAQEIQQFTRMEPHLGFLYFASNNGHILRTDGNNTFDLWSMEPGTVVTDLRSFDGRLFVACSDPLEGSSAAEAVLYQFTGAAVTELKRLGKLGVESSFGRLRALGGKLLFGASSLFGFADGFGIGSYDVVEDSYHILASMKDGSTYAGGTENVSWIVDDIAWFHGKLWCSVRGHGVFRTPYAVRDIENLEAQFDDTSSVGFGRDNSGWLESSEFDAGTPGLLKLWNAIIIDVDLPDTATEVDVDYSLDGGASWVTQATLTKTGAARRYQEVINLGGASGGVYSTTFKYRLVLRTTDPGYTPAVRGISVRYLPVPEPNWVWDMTLMLTDKQQLLDGTDETPDKATLLANLESAFREQRLVTFTDIDGTQWESGGDPGVLIQSMDIAAPFVGPSADGSPEYEVRISLIEAVEEYA